MAGIGFELQRVLKKGGITSFLKVALSGVIIVAGPWLLSIIAIFLIGQFAGFALKEGRSLFMGVIIYSYAFSLFIFGGSHYIFTRFVSDLIYKEKNGEAASSMILFSLIILILCTAVALACVLNIHTENISHPLLFKVCGLVFFAVINIMWLQMIFISLLKQFMSIFVVFLTGMTFSFIGVAVIGKYLALGGAMLGFSLGQLITVILLFYLIFKDFRPAGFSSILKELFTYFTKYKFLFLTGLFYYWGIWIDKIVFWISVGEKVPGTFIKLFDIYDIPVYFSNLTMIPGLIYFVVVCETDFYIYLKDFLVSIAQGTYHTIQEKKYTLSRKMKHGIREQTLFQGMITAVFIILAPIISKSLFRGSVDSFILQQTLVAVFFQLLFLTLMTFLFYFEMYRQSFFGSLVFFLVNLSGSVITSLTGNKNLFGLSYSLAGAAASIVTGVFLFSASKSFDRSVYARYSSVD